MKISFCDFWQYPKSFNPNNNFLIHLIRNFREEVNVVSPQNADIIIFSCFGSENTNYNCKKIFYTGENKRPNFNGYDYSISFDFDDYENRNVRIPLWFWYIDWFGVKSYGNPDYLIPENYLYEENEFLIKPKSLFCTSVYSNPISERNLFINELNNYKKVDCYGKIGGFSYLPDGEKNKMEVISNYKFNICFENSTYPGYYTEKLLHAKISGSIPIYYSDKKMSEDFNESCCLNYSDYKNFEELKNRIIEIDNDKKLYQNLRDEPLFNKKIDLNFLGESLMKIL